MPYSLILLHPYGEGCDEKPRFLLQKKKKKKNLVSFFTENAAGDSPQLSVPSRVAWAEES